MTPEEKAVSLINRMRRGSEMPYEYAKQCALIAVCEIQKELQCAYNGEPITTNEHKEYWQDVKNEIKKP